MLPPWMDEDEFEFDQRENVQIRMQNSNETISAIAPTIMNRIPQYLEINACLNNEWVKKLNW